MNYIMRFIRHMHLHFLVTKYRIVGKCRKKSNRKKCYENIFNGLVYYNINDTLLQMRIEKQKNK